MYSPYILQDSLFKSSIHAVNGHQIDGFSFNLASLR